MPARTTTARAAATALLAALLLVFAAPAAEPAAGTTLGNADIVGMTRANLSPREIVSRITASPNAFDLSDQAFMELKAAGVADEVLSAMLAAGRAGNAATAAADAVNAAVARATGGMPIQLPALPPINANVPRTAGGGVPLISLEGGREWPDIGQELANLPPPPALPSFSAPPGSAPGTSAPQSGFSAPPAFAAPAQTGGLPALPQQGFSAPPVATLPAQPARPAPSFQTTQPMPATPASPVRPPAQPPAAPDPSGTAQYSLSQLRDLLGSPNPAARKDAALALARRNDTLAIAAAEQNLSSPIDPLDGLIYLVGYARLVRASDRLGAILSGNPSPLNRAAAAAALAEIGPGGAAAWPALENALATDADASVRREAARAVARFHEPGSADLLMNACRRDPEVRKIALEAMAEYPETAEFLVSVVGLGPDQIAPDESEAARTSLERLTGQSFGLDGAQWAGWFAENRARFAPGAASAAAPGMPAGSAVAGAPAPAAPGQVDIAALGIIVDPSQIPMAPELMERSAGAPPADGVLRVPGVGAAEPGALSASEFGDTPPGAGGFPGLPAGGSGGGGMAAAPASPSSIGKGRLPTPAGFEEYGDDQMWSGSMPASSASPGGGTDMAGTQRMPQTPPQPAVAASAPRAAPAVPDSGLRLALPPGAGGDDAFGDMSAYGGASPVAAGDMPYDGGGDFGDAFPQQDDGFSQPYADPFAVADGGDPAGFSFDAPQGGGFDPMQADPDGMAETLAFPGDTDAFGIGDPMFGDDGGLFGDGGQLAMPPPPGGGRAAPADDGFADSFGDSFAGAPDGDSALPEDYGYGEYDDGYGDDGGDFGGDDFAALLQDAVGEEAASAPSGGAARYGETDFGVSGGMPPPPPGGGGEAYAEEALAGEMPDDGGEGTVDMLPGIELPPIGEAYSVVTVEEASPPSATDDGTGMVWVRGVGLVDRGAGTAAPAAPAARPEPVTLGSAPTRRLARSLSAAGSGAEAEPVPAPEIAPPPAAAPVSSGASSAAASIEGAVVGEWRTLDPLPGDESGGEEPAPSAPPAPPPALSVPVEAAQEEAAAVPEAPAAAAASAAAGAVVDAAGVVSDAVDGVVLDGEVFEIYELPEVDAVEALPSDPAGRPSRRLRKRR